MVNFFLIKTLPRILIILQMCLEVKKNKNKRLRNINVNNKNSLPQKLREKVGNVYQFLSSFTPNFAFSIFYSFAFNFFYFIFFYFLLRSFFFLFFNLTFSDYIFLFLLFFSSLCFYYIPNLQKYFSI